MGVGHEQFKQPALETRVMLVGVSVMVMVMAMRFVGMAVILMVTMGMVVRRVSEFHAAPVPLGGVQVPRRGHVQPDRSRRPPAAVRVHSPAGT